MAPMVDAFRKRNRFMTDALNAIPGVRCLLSEGAFYAFADMREAIARLNANGVLSDPSDIALSEYLLEDAGVAVVPGSAFGSEGYIRLSFATAMTNLENALSRIEKALA
jgi:aspartate aminotransferase